MEITAKSLICSPTKQLSINQMFFKSFNENNETMAWKILSMFLKSALYGFRVNFWIL